jgi:amino acid transporter
MNCLNVPLFTLLIALSIQNAAPSLSDNELYGVQCGALAIGIAVNIIGTEAIEKVSGALILLAQTPFVVMPVLVALDNGRTLARADWPALAQRSPTLSSSFAVSVSVILWNMQGFNAIGNVAGEVRNPKRDIPVGVFLAAIAITLNYIWPILVTFPLAPDIDDWDTGYFVVLAGNINKTLGYWAVFCCVASSMNNLISQIALGARALQAVIRARMAPDCFAFLGENATRFRTPVPAILASSLVVLGVMRLPFDSIVTVELLMFVPGISLQFAAFMMLRYQSPQAKRPYAVPFGFVGAWAVTLTFAALLAFLVYANLSEGDSVVGAVSVIVFTLVLIVMGKWWARTADCAAILECLSQDDDG